MGTKKETEAESWAVCQGLFHLCSPHLPERPPSLTSVISSMKRPSAVMEDLTQSSGCGPTPADTATPCGLTLELIGCPLSCTKHRLFLCFTFCCAPTESVGSRTGGLMKFRK